MASMINREYGSIEDSISFPTPYNPLSSFHEKSSSSHQKDKRVAWLINHTTLREFEVPLIQSLGFEVYTSKLLPGYSIRTASVEWETDKVSNLHPDVLKALNKHNFYEDKLTPRVIKCLNESFGTIIATIAGGPLRLAGVPVVVTELLKHFKGRIFFRAFGLQSPHTYSNLLDTVAGPWIWERWKQLRHRVWLAPLYPSIAKGENPFLQAQSVVLPVGIPHRVFGKQDSWRGGEKHILFVCPDISNGYYAKTYKEFKKWFSSDPHFILGDQSVPVNDEKVLGYLPLEQYRRFYETSAVMFYHAQERGHLHYHPLEAITYGMPVVFLRGGLMEMFGGPDQPGACSTWREARRKIHRILRGDEELVRSIRKAQVKIMEPFTLEYNERHWKQNFLPRLQAPVHDQERIAISAQPSKLRVAVMLPAPYRGGTFRWLKQVAKMLKRGAHRHGVELDVVVSCLADAYAFDQDFRDLAEMGIKVRPTYWETITREQASASLRIHGQGLIPYPILDQAQYLLPRDRANDFLDANFWLFISDRMSALPLPIRPYGVVVADFLQRYVPKMLDDVFWMTQANVMIPFLRRAEFVVVTTQATMRDLNSYIGVPRKNIQLVPFIECDFQPSDKRPTRHEYFIWLTNPSPHKNHEMVLEALGKYYAELGGSLKTVVMGTDMEVLDPGERDREEYSEYVETIRTLIKRNRHLRSHLFFLGESSERTYMAAIKNARFLLNANLYDNGCLSTVDAAVMGVPSLCASYPAQMEFDQMYKLNATFFDPRDPECLAQSLLRMETSPSNLELPPRSDLEQFDWRNVASDFYSQLRRFIE